jgi:hypothetical protein
LASEFIIPDRQLPGKTAIAGRECQLQSIASGGYLHGDKGMSGAWMEPVRRVGKLDEMALIQPETVSKAQCWRHVQPSKRRRMTV